MSALVSIIIPVYNIEAYLPECLESVLAQTYDNIEVIAVDDGSTDASGAICDAWAAKDGRLKVIHKRNEGVAKARNDGILHSTGDLIGFVDGDDWIEPDMYEILARGCENADMSACGYIDYPIGLDRPIPMGQRELTTDDFETAVIQMYERNGYFTSMCNKLFHREAVMPGGEPILLSGDVFVGEDEMWLIEVMTHCRTFAFIPRACYHYRPRSGSATREERVSDKRMTVLESKKRTIARLNGYDRAAACARTVMYNDCFLMRVQAYATGDADKLSIIRRELKPMRQSWLKAPDLPKMRKLKVMLMELEMGLHLPGALVKATSNVKGYKARGKSI